MVDDGIEQQIRSAAFAHLDRLLAANPDGSLRSRDINTFEFEDRQTPLVVQTGIWKPAGLDAALTIRTNGASTPSTPFYAWGGCDNFA